MKKITFTTLAIVAVASGLAAKDIVRTYPQDIDTVYQAAVRVAKAHYTISNSDPKDHLLTFHTGMGLFTYGMEISLGLETIKNGTQVTARPAKRGTQLFAWGKGAGIAKKFFVQLEQELKGTPKTSQ